MVFNVQSEVIRQLAEKESCVIIGRCADYVLREQSGVTSVFIYADMNDPDQTPYGDTENYPG